MSVVPYRMQVMTGFAMADTEMSSLRTRATGVSWRHDGAPGLHRMSLLPLARA